MIFDVSVQKCVSSVSEWCGTLRRGDNVMIYIAGHGIYDDETNWLVPSDATEEAPALIDVNDVFEKVCSTSPSLKLFIIDATFEAKSGHGSRKRGFELDYMSSPRYASETLIIQSSFGSSVADGGSFTTTAFLESIKIVDLRISDLAVHMRKYVMRQDKNRGVLIRDSSTLTFMSDWLLNKQHAPESDVQLEQKEQKETLEQTGSEGTII